MTAQEPKPTAIFRSLADVPAEFGPCVAAIGNFDGVHRGHQQILAATVAEARPAQARSLAVTFDPHPERFLRPERAPRLITPMQTRLPLLEGTGVDAVLVLPFDAELASMRAHEFVEQILVNRLHVQTLHEGASFRFGHRAEGGVTELEAFGRELGFEVHIHSAVRVHGIEVSSTATRAAIAAGDVKRARWMLGRPFSMQSTHRAGRGVGAKLLVPTVNFARYDELLPAAGVYGTRLHVAGQCFQAVTNIGNRPTFDEAGFAIETHILDFEPFALDDSTPLTLEFLVRLREERKFAAVEDLRAQIALDVAKARRCFARLADE